ncbi:adenosylmethionine--8-amino-7-oxononanoate transaminase [Lutimonas halocynthiae]|uniref:adenosylmethionine--8-amino-7-oxononanoate transaminase n=1 Tax=Lutimonas halocynthiae TaxID=1446477 RepID=UPI0025B3C56E|nr:adenosylmethionine--8-amino-7-oxononanoate transaminase [Lutimonas halocynthiae]MDN3642449.1 adenosylmethionine--8-amino-7-oxononanoate transaminase [Lutimonas halocynthiae]
MNLKQRDRKHLWHPLTQHKLHPEHLPIVRAEGVWLFDDEGNKYIDGIASWYTCMYGHSNPKIISAVKQQLGVLDQVVFSGFTHPPAIELSEKLMDILPDNMAKIFFSDNGSTSVDVAIKIALQYYFNKGEKRNKVIALHNAFHGDTFGAMSVSGLSVYNGPFEDFLLRIERIAVPDEQNWESVVKEFKNLLDTGEVAAFIYEPLVQGAASMHMFAPEHLDQLISIAQKAQVLTIADEVMTGFGKTGLNFASEYMEAKPDLICLSKSLTAGVAPMALTCCSQKVYDAFYDDEISKGFFHGHTYSANPLACTAAIAGIDLLCSEEIQNNIQRINKRHLKFERHISNNPKVKSTRVRGVIFALDLNVQMDRYGKLRDQLYAFFMKEGVVLRPLGNTVYTLPPYVITDSELDKIYEVIEKCLDII